MSSSPGCGGQPRVKCSCGRACRESRLGRLLSCVASCFPCCCTTTRIPQLLCVPCVDLTPPPTHTYPVLPFAPFPQYSYYLRCGDPAPTAALVNHAGDLYAPTAIDVEAMHRTLQAAVGTHDFALFGERAPAAAAARGFARGALRGAVAVHAAAAPSSRPLPLPPPLRLPPPSLCTHSVFPQGQPRGVGPRC
jgi:hypothetical protein